MASELSTDGNGARPQQHRAVAETLDPPSDTFRAVRICAIAEQASPATTVAVVVGKFPSVGRVHCVACVVPRRKRGSGSIRPRREQREILPHSWGGVRGNTPWAHA